MIETHSFPGDQATPTAALIKSQGGSAIFIKTDLVQLDQVEALVLKISRVPVADDGECV